MKIVHIANFYGPNSGGIKTTLHELGRGYIRYGHEFIYIVPGTIYFEEPTPYGLKIYLPSMILPGSGGYQIIRSNSKLRKLLAELNPDRIEVSDRFTLLSIGRWARRKQIPTIVFSHETLRGLAERFLPLPKGARNVLVNAHNRRLAKTFDQVVTTTDFAASEFKEIGAQNLVRAPLGVDLDIFQPSNRSLAYRRELLKGAKVLLVHCGRLSPEKEPQRSVEALIELRARGVDARLVIVGIGPMWKKIREMAKGHPIDTLGYIADRNRVARILACADVSLAPGPLETFCLAALESLASGTPVVASETSAVGEFLLLDKDHPAGATAANSGIGLAESILSVLGKKFMRARARAVAEQFPWETTIATMRNHHGITEIGQSAPFVSTKRRLKAS